MLPFFTTYCEDTPVSKEEIHQFLSALMDASSTKRTVQLVDESTDRFIKASYPQWNRRVRKSKEANRLAAASGDAQTIKYDMISSIIVLNLPARNRLHGSILRECNALLKKWTKESCTAATGIENSGGRVGKIEKIRLLITP